MNLSRFPRRRYTPGTTPIELLPHLSKLLGGPNIYVKRDDLLGLTAGGNKTRKLEFLVGDALEKGADTLITCGAVQSNHCRLSLSAAVKEGMDCFLVLEQRVPNSYKKSASGNNFLYELMGVTGVHVVDGGTNLMAKMEEIAEKLQKQGKKPYIMPGGGSNEIGSLGYAACAQEILNQTFEMGIKIDNIVLTSGSAGTHAGMLTGMTALNGQIPITGIGINKENARQIPTVHKLAMRTAEKLGLANAPDVKDIIIFDEYIGEGYSIPTDAMIEAVKMFARVEGILLDPVYTGKTAAGMIDLIKKGYFEHCENILFLHTGGSPALYHYMEDFAL